MRIYRLDFPGDDHQKPEFFSSVRSLRNLPEGTECCIEITERDGTLCEVIAVPVEGGRVQVSGNGKRRPKMWYG